MSLLYILANKYIAPQGMRVLWMVIIILIILIVLYVRYWYRNYWKNPLRIRKRSWYSGGLKMSVRILNKSKDMVEIDTPLIEFRQPHMTKRRFKIKTPGSSNLFPLVLSPHTSYDFLIEFTKMFDMDPILRKYKRAILYVKDNRGRTITKRKVKISIPS